MSFPDFGSNTSPGGAFVINVERTVTVEHSDMTAQDRAAFRSTYINDVFAGSITPEDEPMDSELGEPSVPPLGVVTRCEAEPVEEEFDDAEDSQDAEKGPRQASGLTKTQSNLASVKPTMNRMLTNAGKSLKSKRVSFADYDASGSDLTKFRKEKGVQRSARDRIPLQAVQAQELEIPIPINAEPATEDVSRAEQIAEQELVNAEPEAENVAIAEHRVAEESANVESTAEDASTAEQGAGEEAANTAPITEDAVRAESGAGEEPVVQPTAPFQWHLQEPSLGPDDITETEDRPTSATGHETDAAFRGAVAETLDHTESRSLVGNTGSGTVSRRPDTLTSSNAGSGLSPAQLRAAHPGPQRRPPQIRPSAFSNNARDLFDLHSSSSDRFDNARQGNLYHQKDAPNRVNNGQIKNAAVLQRSSMALTTSGPPTQTRQGFQSSQEEFQFDLDRRNFLERLGSQAAQPSGSSCGRSRGSLRDTDTGGPSLPQAQSQLFRTAQAPRLINHVQNGLTADNDRAAVVNRQALGGGLSDWNRGPWLGENLSRQPSPNQNPVQAANAWAASQHTPQVLRARNSTQSLPAMGARVVSPSEGVSSRAPTVGRSTASSNQVQVADARLLLPSQARRAVPPVQPPQRQVPWQAARATVPASTSTPRASIYNNTNRINHPTRAASPAPIHPAVECDRTGLQQGILQPSAQTEAAADPSVVNTPTQSSAEATSTGSQQATFQPTTQTETPATSPVVTLPRPYEDYYRPLSSLGINPQVQDGCNTTPTKKNDKTKEGNGEESPQKKKKVGTWKKFRRAFDNIFRKDEEEK